MDKPLGRIVIAHPSCVAQADQIAAAEGVRRVVLNEEAPPMRAYIVDLDYLIAWPDGQASA